MTLARMEETPAAGKPRSNLDAGRLDHDLCPVAPSPTSPAPRRSRNRSHSFRFSGLSRIATLSVAALCSTVPVFGDVSWIGGVGNYNTGSNWSSGVVPDGNDAVVIENGGTAESSNYVGAASVTIGGGSTLAILEGIVSQFSVFESFYAGSSGTGNVTLGSQSLLATGDFYAGYAAGSNSLVSLTGATLSPDDFYAGYNGQATVILTGGSTLESTEAYVGNAAGSQGLVQLTTSTWKVEEEGLPVALTVGVSGQGEIQSTSSVISALTVTLAANAGSSGTVSLNSGSLTVQEQILVGNAGTGTLSLAGAAVLSSDGMTVGAVSQSSGNVTITDSTIQSSANVFVGLSGSGTLTTQGSEMTAPEIFIGRNAGANGTVVLSGGTTTLTGELHVGAEGDGIFTLNGGGLLNSDRGNMGYATGSSGEATIADGHWNVTQAIFVGVTGEGALNIGASGLVSSESGYISQNAAGQGTVTITGGTWAMTNTLAVGVNGTAVFSATDGAVSSAWGQLGLNAGSKGTVTLNNASWTTTQTLTIGSAGEGELVATNGSSVTAGSVELAAAASSTGSLTVTNSTLNTENVIAANAGATAEFSSAQLNLLGGSSVVDTLLIDGFAAGAVVISGSGLTIDTQGGNAQIASVLSGTGALIKAGNGRLRLNTANTFSGGTIITGGVVEFGVSGALGSGTTRLGSAELRAIADVILSTSQPGSPPELRILAGQTGTISANSGVTLTLGLPQFSLGDGSAVQFGSAGHTGTVVFAPETVSLSTGNNRIVVQTGTVTAGNGALEEVTAASESTTVAAGATLDFQDHLTDGGINALFGSGTVHTGTLSTTTLVIHSGSFAGNISGEGALVKNTAGTLVLSGQNAFLGGTTVNAGTLVVDGDLSFGLGAATVNETATLSGDGILGTIFLDGGTVAPGSSAGTLTAQNLYWTDGVLLFDLGATQAASDLLVVGGLEGFGDTYAFTFVDQGWVVGGTYNLINFVASDIAIDDFRFTNAGGFDGDFAYSGGYLQFTLTAVPEPSSLTLAALALIIAGSSRYRRNRVTFP